MRTIPHTRANIVVSAACLFVLRAYSPGLADMAYLNNGQTVEGVITKQDGTNVTLDAGYGTITIQNDQIKRIVKYTAASQEALRDKWRVQYFLRTDFVPAALSSLIPEFNSLESARNKAVASKVQKDHTETEIQAQSMELAKLKAEAAEVNTVLSGITPGNNIKEYNALVEKINSLMSRIGAKEYRLAMLRQESPALEKIIERYIDDLRAFNEQFNRRYRMLDKNSAQQGKYLFSGIARRLQEMDSDFTKQTAPYTTSGSNIIVHALLNDRVSANLMLDTGATLVTISQEIAQKLGVDLKGENITFPVTLADGRKVDAIPVMLKSIKVGSIEANDIPAVVLKDSQSSDDGLLGLSFLKNFMVRIDAKAGTLLFEQFNP